MPHSPRRHTGVPVVVRLRWPDGLQVPEGAVGRVSVQEITEADAAAVEVGGVVLTGLHRRLPRLVTVTVPEVDPQAVYAVRVHVSLASGRPRGVAPGVARGDLVSTESHPVLTFGAPAEVTVSPRVVG